MDYIFVKKDKVVKKVYLSDIFYIGTKDVSPRILQFVTADEVYEMYGRIKKFETSLGLTFMRCHRRYLVNLRKIAAIDTDTRNIIFNTDKVTPIVCSRRKLVNVIKIWKNF